MFKKISAFFFFYFAIVSVYVIFLPKILSQIGYTPFEIGAIFSAAPLVRFILPFIFRKYFEVDKRIFYLALSNLLFVIMFFYISIGYFWLFLFANILFGASMGVILPYIESFSLEYLKKQRYGKARLYGSLGFIITGLVLAKILNSPYIGLHFMFTCIVLTAICSVLIVSNNRQLQLDQQKTKSTLSLVKYARFWISLFLLQVSFGAFYNFFTIYETSYGISLEMISWMWTLGVVCEIILFYFQAPILKRYSTYTLIKFSCLITSIRWLMLYLFPGIATITFISQSLHAASFALLHTSAFSHLHTLYKDTPRLASQFYYGISYGLGGFIGSLIAGATYGVYVYLVSSLIAFLAFLIYDKSSNE